MNIGWPEGIMLFLIFAGVGISIARFGEQKRDGYDWMDVLFAPAISIALLYWGGFFA